MRVTNYKVAGIKRCDNINIIHLTRNANNDTEKGIITAIAFTKEEIKLGDNVQTVFANGKTEILN